MTRSGKDEYSFSESEVRTLALLLRKHEDVLDSSLDSFSAFIEDLLYSNMTIEEAEAFFDEQ